MFHSARYVGQAAFNVSVIDFDDGIETLLITTETITANSISTKSTMVSKTELDDHQRCDIVLTTFQT